MDEKLLEICNALDSLSNKIISSFRKDSVVSDGIGNWLAPHLTKQDLAHIPGNLSDRIKSANIEALPEELLLRLTNIPERIERLNNQVIPNLFSTHSKDCTGTFLTTMTWVESMLTPIFSWEYLEERGAVPPKLKKKLKTLQTELESLDIDKQDISKSLKMIQEATSAIENLTEDLTVIKNAKKNIEKNKDESALLFEKINELHKVSDKDYKSIKEMNDEAKKIIDRCEDAYRITNTQGLASAFQSRATSLTTSMWQWVFLLFLALAIGGSIGSVRFETLTQLLKTTNINTSYVIMEFVLSILSIGAPIWFAWIATKQIGQRFKLAEDYGFKASVAKAYEGYKKEAQRLDQHLELRLFTSAVTRLEEAPLRLMDDKTHGSPWQELFESEQFKNAIDNVPGFKDKLLEILDRKIPNFSKNGSSTTEV
ncbi:hypothetical protein [Flavobacterium sp. H122]|uniref:hypothetical protein n=1 Tax=Flavobacterium sp. H122 TaxID=2529860 RepID=UPI0010AA8A7E|nr:hypothetical protein [Flavobacterium sp. H122]